MSDLDNLRVVLVAPRNPLNIGAAARAMSNFGVQRLRVVNPYEVAFRTARSAVGASDLLAKAEQYNSVADAVADCRLVVGTTAVGSRDLQHRLLKLDKGGLVIKRQLKTEPVALLFGSERFGLSNEELSHCHWLMRIPTAKENISMNLGQAVAVTLYELARDAKVARLAEKYPPAASQEVERITASLLHVLQASDFLGRRQVKTAEERIRRLVRRLQITARDTDAWLGMLRQITWKIGSASSADPDTNKS
jgi:TrmH family RNA methyltransferase